MKGSRERAVDVFTDQGAIAAKMKFVPKFKTKYSDWNGEPNLLWDRDLKIDNGIAFLPLYMASLL